MSEIVFFMIDPKDDITKIKNLLNKKNFTETFF